MDNIELRALKTVLKGAAIALLGAFVGRFLGYLSRVVMARYLGPGEYGLASLAISVLGIIFFFSTLGITNAVIRFVSVTRGDKTKTANLVRTSLILVLLSASIAMALMLQFSDAIAVSIFGVDRLDSLLQVLAVFIPVSALGAIAIAVGMAHQNMTYRVYSEDLGKNVVRLGTMVLLFSLGYHVMGAIVAYVAGIAASTLLAIYFVTKGGINIFSGRFDANRAREILSYSWPLMLSSAALVLIAHMDTLMIGYYLNTRDVGLYNAALPTAQVLVMVPAALMSLFLPVVSELHTKGHLKDVDRVYKVVTKWLFFVSFPAFLLMAIFSDHVLRILFGSTYVGGQQALVILAAGYLIACLLYAATDMLNLLKKTRLQFAIVSVSLAINVAMNVVLIPRYGINGAAAATAFSLTMSAMAMTYYAYKYGGYNPLSTSLVKPMVASVLAAGAIYAAAIAFLSPVSIYTIALLFVPFVILYTALLHLFRAFGPEDIELGKSLIKRVKLTF